MDVIQDYLTVEIESPRPSFRLHGLTLEQAWPSPISIIILPWSIKMMKWQPSPNNNNYNNNYMIAGGFSGPHLVVFGCFRLPLAARRRQPRRRSLLDVTWIYSTTPPLTVEYTWKESSWGRHRPNKPNRSNRSNTFLSRSNWNRDYGVLGTIMPCLAPGPDLPATMVDVVF